MKTTREVSRTLRRVLGVLLAGPLLFALSSGAYGSVAADVAFDRIAQRLELVRNQMELTINNHATVSSDINRQSREMEGMEVFLRIPLAKYDLKSDTELLESIRSDFEKARKARTGFELRKITVTSPWKAARKNVPATIAFDDNYRVTEDQVADWREIRIEVKFTGSPPSNPDQWLESQQHFVRRLLEPIRWEKTGVKSLACVAKVFRFRDFEFPKMIAPDLSRYRPPSAPDSPMQKAAARRIEKYREEIPWLWPKTQPYLDDLRTFARNDLRMNFFLKHAKIHSR